MTTWIVVALLAVGTFVIKATGPVLLGRHEPSERSTAVIALLAPVLLTALVVYQATSGPGRGIVLDARLVGLAAAGAALAARLPLIAVVVIAALTTALVRLIFSS